MLLCLRLQLQEEQIRVLNLDPLWPQPGFNDRKPLHKVTSWNLVATRSRKQSETLLF